MVALILGEGLAISLSYVQGGGCPLTRWPGDMSLLEKGRVTKVAAIWVISPGMGDPLPQGNKPVSEQVAYSESELNQSQVPVNMCFIGEWKVSRWGLPLLLWQHFQVVKFGSRLESY